MRKVTCSTCWFRYKDIKLPNGMVQCSVSKVRKRELSPRECKNHRVLTF